MKMGKATIVSGHHGRLARSFLSRAGDEQCFPGTAPAPRDNSEMAITRSTLRKISIKATSVLTTASISDAPISRQVPRSPHIFLLRQPVLDRSELHTGVRFHGAPRRSPF